MKKIKLFFVAMLMSAVAINSYGQAVGTSITYDGITGTEVSTEADAEGYIYNLQGQRVNGSAKGLYIKNGKKYIKK